MTIASRATITPNPANQHAMDSGAIHGEFQLTHRSGSFTW